MSATSSVSITASTRVDQLPGVGAVRARHLAHLGIVTVSDLLRHLPMRYELEAAESSVQELPGKGIGAVRGTIVGTRWVASHGGRTRGRFEATLEGQGGRILLTWFNARYLVDKLHPGHQIRVWGKVDTFREYRQMVNPKWELLDDSQAPARDERIRPIYPASEQINSAAIERLIGQVLDAVLPTIHDPLPEELRKRNALPDLAQAFRMAHRPGDMDETGAARRRLAYNELLLLQLGIAIKRHYNEHVLHAPALRWSRAIDEHIRQRFPFELTEAQRRVCEEIARDLQRDRPMNRLLQGDVGAGKTVVALYALLMAVADRKQGVLMAPTELLAEQHMASLSNMLAGSQVRIALLTGSLPAAARRQLLDDIVEGRIDIVVGTQALLGGAVRFKDLALAVIDEQHRFGVMQRAFLRQLAGGAAEGEDTADAQNHRVPHCLVMTATPIPRTLSLTVFGDLDVSTITGLPPGRQPIITRVVGPEKSDDVYRYMVQRLERGEQAYVVVPAIDEENARATNAQLKSVRAHVKLLQDKYCGQRFRVAAVHGRLKRETREAIMKRFRDGFYHVLVATTVIEVGVDVPNASVMVVEHAERFGLAQLHQLRGRVGRGANGRQALCVFIADPTTPEASQRMAAIASTTDGFKIAESDLEIRGMGDFFGTRQHGAPPLRVAEIPRDLELLNLARRDAQTIVDADPALTAPEHHRLRAILTHQYGQTLGLIDVG